MADKRYYEHSPQKRAEMLKDCHITPEDVEAFESEEYDIHSESVERLLVYIRNYDENGNLIDSPNNAVKTCIDTFESTLLKETWYSRELFINEDGSSYYDKQFNEEISEASNAALLADPEILKVEPLIVKPTLFLNQFIRSYFDNYKINKRDGGKTLYIEIHEATDSFLHYDFNDTDIAYYKRKNFDIIGLNLSGKTFSIDNNSLIELNTFSLENATLKLNSETGLAAKCDSFYMSSVKIDSKFKKVIATISLTVKETVKISYITFENDICKFDILSSVSQDMQKWISTNVDIYGVDFNAPNEYSDKLDSLFRFDGVHEVKITSLNITLAKFSMPLCRFRSIANVILNSINLICDEITNNVLSFTGVTNITACSIQGVQSKEGSGKVYLISTNNGMLLGEYKFISAVSKHIGLYKSSSDNSDIVNFHNCKSEAFGKPIGYMSSSINKMVFTKCYFDKLADFSLNMPKISMFGCKFTHIENVNLTISKKMYFSDSSISGNTCSIQSLQEGEILLDTMKIVFDSFTIQGDSGTGSYKQKNVTIKADEVKFDSLSKLGSEESYFETKELYLSGKKISSFNPNFDNTVLDKVTVKGNIINSLFLFKNKSKKAVEFNVTNCMGNINIHYFEEVGNIDLNVESSRVKFDVYTSKTDDVDALINLICKEDCTGSVLTSHNENMKFVPVSEGSFKDLKRYKDGDILTNKEWTNQIAYGHKK
ncbi:MAG: hypothetical protein ACRC5M_06780 [Anaeroplasmataceae bacterium]